MCVDVDDMYHVLQARAVCVIGVRLVLVRTGILVAIVGSRRSWLRSWYLPCDVRLVVALQASYCTSPGAVLCKDDVTRREGTGLRELHGSREAA